jgi:hypothetical protein
LRRSVLPLPPLPPPLPPPLLPLTTVPDFIIHVNKA